MCRSGTEVKDFVGKQKRPMGRWLIRPSAYVQTCQPRESSLTKNTYDSVLSESLSFMRNPVQVPQTRGLRVLSFTVSRERRYQLLGSI